MDGRLDRWQHERTELDIFGIAPRSGGPDLPAAFRRTAGDAVGKVLDPTLPTRNRQAMQAWQVTAGEAMADKVEDMEDLKQRQDELRQHAGDLAVDWKAATEPPEVVVSVVDALVVVPPACRGGGRTFGPGRGLWVEDVLWKVPSRSLTSRARPYRLTSYVAAGWRSGRPGARIFNRASGQLSGSLAFS